MKLLNRTVMAAVALSLCGPLHALDDQRQGFFVSVGAGYSTSEYIDNSFASASRQGLGTSFRIGGGFNNRTIGYYVRHVAWSAELENSLGFSGAGVAHYFSPTSKSAYINAAVGFGDSVNHACLKLISPWSSGSSYYASTFARLEGSSITPLSS